MRRRHFLQSGVAAALAAALDKPTVRGADPGVRSRGIERIDTNVSLFQWPGRRLPHDDPESLQRLLDEYGITQAWAGSFEGILARDVSAVNVRLAEACSASRGRLIPFGTINPMQPGWEEDLRRCHEIHRMRGIRLHPNYHGYKLDHPTFRELLGRAADRKLVVQIACLLEDFRTHHPLLSVPDVDVAPLSEALSAAPAAQVLLLNSGKLVDGTAFDRLARLRGVYFDTARVETVGGVGRLLRKAPAGRVVFGSHAPFFILAAGAIKIFESGLTEAEVRRLVCDNPRALLDGLG